MPLNYKPIGDYVQRVERRNTDLKVTRLLGLSLTKEFRATTSNIVGTDMSVYRVMHKHEFACDFMSPIRVNKLPVVLKLDDEPNLVSPAYPVFRVKDPNELDPEYLMMWFRRPEFDRYATFKCDAAIRGGYDWQELCNTLIPVPAVEKQREIVAEYNTIQNRIAINNQLIQSLETTAQAIYKQWFVEFEFPNEAGQPYKSSGGELVDSELGEIPKGWSAGTLEDISSQIMGFAFKGEMYSSEAGISVLRGENVSEGFLRWDTHKKWDEEIIARMRKGFLQENDIVIGMDGSKVGKNWAMVSKYDLPLLLAQRVSCIRGKEKEHQNFIFYSMKVLGFGNYVSQVQTGTSIPHVSGQQIYDFPIIIPSDELLVKYHSLTAKIIRCVSRSVAENKQLIKFRSLLLSKLATIETTPAAPHPAAPQPAQLTLAFA